MSKQTAVEWLIEEMHKNIDWIPIPMQEKAKQMEKEQRIDDIVQFGIKYEHKYSQMEIIKLCESAEQYYNETFKSE
jgi:hypothetical protein